MDSRRTIDWLASPGGVLECCRGHGPFFICIAYSHIPFILLAMES